LEGEVRILRLEEVVNLKQADKRAGMEEGKETETGEVQAHLVDIYLEQAREIPIRKSYDVIVCGAGPAGIAAALTAAREGASTLLVEMHGCLGGIWTAGALSWIIDASDKPGIMREIIDRLNLEGGCPPVPKRAGQSFPYDPEVMKRVLEEMCVEASIDILLHTRAASAGVDPVTRRLSYLVTESKSGRQAWRAEMFVDATGDGDLSALAGCQYEVGRPDNGETQPMSLMALLTGIDFAEVGSFCMNNRIPEDGRVLLFEELARAGIKPSYGAPTLIYIRDGLFALMANHEYGVSATDAAAITRATLSARAELHRMVQGLRLLGKHWSGLQIVSTAEQIGVREGRRVHGLYTTDEHDLLQGARHEDAIARATFGIDIHSTNPQLGQSYGSDGKKSLPYDIPLRSLIAKDVNGLLMAGRCISGDFVAHSSYRVTGNAVAMGEAAGTAAALASSMGTLPQHLPWSLLKKRLAFYR
jgi:hypothetical protein